MEEQEIRKQTKKNTIQSLLIIGLFFSAAGMLVSLLIYPSFLAGLVDGIVFLTSMVLLQVLHRKGYQDITAFTVWILYDLVWLPSMILYGGGLFGGASIMFVLGIVISCILFDGFWVFGILGFQCVFYCTFVTILFYHDYQSPLERSAVGVYCSDLFCLIAAVMVLIAIVLQEERMAKQENEHKNISENKIAVFLAQKNIFMDEMTHTSRTLSNTVLGMTELLLKEDVDNDIKDELMTVKGNALHLLSFMDDLHTLSELDAGKHILIKREFSFVDIYKEVLNIVKRELGQKRIFLDFQLDPSIPKVLYGDPDQIRQIITSLLFVTLDMVDNGRILFHVKAENDPERGETRLNCRLADTGRGLNGDDEDSIYSIYETYDSRQDNDMKAIGLKYSICRELVKLMNGSFSMESLQDVGMAIHFSVCCEVRDFTSILQLKPELKPEVLVYAKESVSYYQTWQGILDNLGIQAEYARNYYMFHRKLMERQYTHIFIPNQEYSLLANILKELKCEEKVYVICGDEFAYGDFGKCRMIRRPVTALEICSILNDGWKREAFLQAPAKSNLSLKKTSILVVDDNSVNLKVASGILHKYNADVDLARTGEECLQKLENVKYDMIFLDMVMPGMNGDEVLQQIRDREDSYYKDLPVIALTASAGGNIREELLEKGYQEYLTKPIKIRYLEKCLLAFLPEEKLERQYDDSKIKNPESRQLSKKVLEKFHEIQLQMNLKECEHLLKQLTKMKCAGQEHQEIREIEKAFDEFDFTQVVSILEKMIQQY
ncbi:MAG: response regulator [Lachnospiraceae bacterium]|nr:response regulator [Lachnospiraceae bacterium]